MKVQKEKPPSNSEAGEGTDLPVEAHAFFERLRRELPSVLREAVRAELSAASAGGAPDEPEPLLTKDDVAERLSVSPRTVDTLAAEGALRKIRVRGCIRFHPETVDAYIRRTAEEGAA